MALITLRQLLDHAAENQYGVPAFNINNMEQGLAILKAADKTVVEGGSHLVHSHLDHRILPALVIFKLGSGAMKLESECWWVARN